MISLNEFLVKGKLTHNNHLIIVDAVHNKIIDYNDSLVGKTNELSVHEFINVLHDFYVEIDREIFAMADLLDHIQQNILHDKKPNNKFSLGHGMEKKPLKMFHEDVYKLLEGKNVLDKIKFYVRISDEQHYEMYFYID